MSSAPSGTTPLPQAPAPANTTADTPAPHGASVLERVDRVLRKIRPAVQADGGDLELVGLTPEGIAQIRLHGACVGCPSSVITLQMGIERNLRTHVPEVKGVQAVP